MGANAKTIQVTLKTVADISDVTSNVKQIQKVINQLTLPENLKSSFTKVFSEIEKNVDKASQALSSGLKTKGDTSAFTKNMNRISTLMVQLQNNMSKISPDILKKSLDIDTTKLEAAKKAITDIQQQLTQKIDASNLQKVEQAAENLSKVSKAKSIQNFVDAFKSGNFDEAEKALQKLEQGLSKVTDPSKIDTYKTSVEAMRLAFTQLVSNGDIQNLQTQLNAAQQELQNLGQTEFNDLLASFQQLVTNLLPKAAQETNAYINTTNNAKTAQQQLNSELEQFKSRITYFFGMNNAVNLFQRAIRSAYETIKDLDAVMTETAVVTDFSIGDMWSQLPEYTKRANELGVSIHSAYEAATIYYQQGLKTNEVVAVSNETLKMARIAGLDAATATDRMTNALRGFNMEINETNAQRVDDVYNKLAAISASNVDEISTAMTKVASLANSANMEFETTSAFLAQMIETTRESAETAGTALKTVVARFSEVKELFSEGELLGTDSEGEAIDVNKVSAALRTAGINLNEYLTGMKGLDDIFIELAQKWDSLDIVQQRYIATMAAGSRQQSRFIAMMSDYDRTMELVNAASNSTGAANEMFEKTLESLETKLTELKNAWNEFTMGLANSTIVKGAIDVITWLINKLNTLTSAFGDTGGAIAKLALAFAGLKVGKVLFGKFIDSLLSQFLSAGKESGTSFMDGLKEKINGSNLKSFFKKEVSHLSSAISGALKNNNDLSLTSFFNNNSFSAQELMPIMDDIEQQFKTKINFGQLTGEELGKANQAINDFRTAVTNGTGQAGDAISGMNEALASTNQQLEITPSMAGTGYKQISNNFMTMAAAASGAAMVLGLLANGLEKLGVSKEVANSIRILSTALGILAGILMVLPALCEALSISIKAIPIVGWIAAAISALIALISIIDSFNKSNSIEGKMEKAAQATENAKKAADEAKNAYDELLNNQKEYSSLQETLENLTRGTVEWKQALFEANQQVLELLGHYPELAKYLDRGNSGQLTINPEGWDYMIDTAKNAVANTSANELKSQINEINLQKENARGQLVEEAKNQFKDFYFQPEKTGKNIKELISSYIKNPDIWALDENSSYKKGLVNLANELNTTAESIYGMRDAISSYVKTSNDAEAELLSDASAMLTAQSTKAAEYKFGGRITDAFAQGVVKEDSDYNVAIEKSAEDMAGKNNAQMDAFVGGVSEDFKRLAEEYNVTSEMTDDSVKNLKTLYAAMAELDVNSDVVQNMERDELAQKIAEMDQTKKLAAAMDELTTKIQGLSKEDQDKTTALLGKDFTGMNLAEVQDVNAKKDLAGLNLSDEQAKAMGYDTVEDLYAGIEEVAAKEADRLDTIIYKPLRKKLSDSSELNALATGVAENLNNQIAGMSDDGAKKYFDAFNAAVSSVDLKDNKALSDYLSSLDLSDMGQLVEAHDYMRELGADTTTIDNFWKTATKDIHPYIDSISEASTLMDRLHEKSNNTDEIEDRLVKGEATSEDIATLETAGVDLSSLERTAKGWKLTEDAAKSATDVIRQGLADSTQEALEAQIATQQYYDTLANDFKYSLGINIKDENGEYQDFNQLDDIQKTATSSALMGGTAETLGMTEAEYWTKAEEKYNDYVNSRLHGDQILDTLQKELNYQRATKMTAAENEATGGSDQSIIMSAQREAVQAGLDANEVMNFANALQTVKTDLNEVTAAQAALANSKMNAGLGEIIDSYEDWSSLIDENTGLIKASTSDDVKAFANLKASVNKMLNTSEDLSDAFWDNADNMANIKKAAEGDADALGSLQKAAAKDYLVNLALNNDPPFEEDAINSILTLADFIANYDLPKLEAGEILDDQDFLTRCNELIAASGMTATQVSNAFKDMGYDVEFDPNPQSVPQQQTVPVTTYSIQYDDHGNVTKMIPSVEMETFKYEAEMAAPTIKTLTSTGSGGGGVSVGNRSAGAAKKPKSSGGGGGGGSKGGSSEKPSYWENSYDELYNLQERINESLRTRESLERRYQKLLNKTASSLSEIRKAYYDQIGQLRIEANLQQTMAQGRARQLSNVANETYTNSEGVKRSFASMGVTKYASYDKATGVITIDWAGLDAISRDASREEEGNAAEAYISRLEELVEGYEEIRDKLWDIEDKIEELRDEVVQTYLDFEDRVMEAVVNEYQEQIDAFQAMSDEISDTTSKVLDSIKEEIDLARQIRDNTKTEEEISDMENRLAYLRRDTSGANDLEIMQLEKDLEDARQNYTDTLIDQALDQMQKDADLAAEQRAQQQETLQNQLDIMKENGSLWDRVYTLIRNAEGSDGSFSKNSELVKLLKSNEGFNNLSNIGKAKWWEEAAAAYKAAMVGKNEAEDKYGVDADNDKVIAKTGTNKAVNNVTNQSKTVSTTPASTSSTKTAHADKEKYGVALAIINGSYGWGSGTTRKKNLEAKGFNYNEIQGIVSKLLAEGKVKSGAWVGAYYGIKDLKPYAMSKFKSGGLADFTGPAWLDGTKSHPELVLDATDSQNFITLKNILAQLLNGQGAGAIGPAGGDNYFDIDISAELGSDYDVDQLANRIKKQIYDNGAYRNVNTINYLR